MTLLLYRHTQSIISADMVAKIPDRFQVRAGRHKEWRRFFLKVIFAIACDFSIIEAKTTRAVFDEWMR